MPMDGRAENLLLGNCSCVALIPSFHGHTAFSALPTSDLYGWRKCNRIVGTILAMWVGRKLLLAFSALPTSMWVVFRKEPGVAM